MPFRAPGSGVLGPRPPAQQAMVAQQQPLPPAHYSPPAWDNSALYAALTSAGVATQPPSAADWYLDTGASSHMSSGSGIAPPSLTPFHSFVTVGNGARLPVTHTAAGVIPASTPLHLNNVLVTPSIVKNLISVRQLTRDNNVSIEFDPAGFSIKDMPTRKETLRCDSPGDLYPLRLPSPQALSASSPASVELWHNRLGHPGSAVLQQVLHSLHFHCNKTTAHSCHHCSVGKHARLPFHSSESPAYFPFQLVHSDVWTSPVYSHSGYKYYVVFIDAYTHYIWTYPVRQKSDVALVLRSFFSYVHTQFRLPIVAFQTDNGTEFDNAALRSFFSAQGTSFRLSCPYTSQQNGKAERILRTINDCIRTLLLHSAAPLSFWAEALNTATFLINRRPCRATGSITPHHLLLGVPPRYDELRVFGCLCYPNITATTAHKLSPRSVACVFLGYPTDHRGYRCYDMTSGRVYTSRHVTFVEHAFPFRAVHAQTPSPMPTSFADDDDPAVPARAPTTTVHRHQQRAMPPPSAQHTPSRSSTTAAHSLSPSAASTPVPMQTTPPASALLPPASTTSTRSPPRAGAPTWDQSPTLASPPS